MWTRKRKLIALVSGVALVLIIVLSQSQNKFTPKVISIQPINGAKEVDTNTYINVSFGEAIPESERGKIFVRLVPGVSTTNTWISSNLLQVAPQAELSAGVAYKVNISFDNKEIYNSSFETVFFQAPTAEEVQEMTQMAFDTNAAFYKTVETFPFVTKLPIRKDNYTVVYDYDLAKFRIRLKMPSNAPEDTKQEAINDALAEMKAREINIDEFGGYHILYSE